MLHRKLLSLMDNTTGKRTVARWSNTFQILGWMSKPLAALALGLIHSLVAPAFAQPFGPIITIPIEKVREHYNNPHEDGTGKNCGVRLYGEWRAYLNYTNSTSYRIFTPGLQSLPRPQNSVPEGGRFRFYCYFNGISSPRNDAVCPTEIGNGLPDWYVEVQRRGPRASFDFRPEPANLGMIHFKSLSTDPEGDPIAFESWDFGDGTDGSGVSLIHRYEKPGTFPVRLTVTDSDGLTNAGTINVSVPAPKLTVSLRVLSKHENNRIEPREVFRVRATVAASAEGVGDLSGIVFTGPALSIPTNLTLLEAPVTTEIGTLQPGMEKVFEWVLRGGEIGDFALLTASLTGKDASGRRVTASRASALGTVTALIAGIEQRPRRVVLGEDNNGDGVVNGADARVELILGVTNVAEVAITDLHTDNLEEPIQLKSRLFDVPVALEPITQFSGNLGSIQPGAGNAVFRTNIYQATNYVFSTASVIVRGTMEGSPVQTGAESIAQVENPGVGITMHSLGAAALTAESIGDGQLPLDAPLQPVTTAGVLAAQPEVSAGLMGDGVTPLLFTLKADTKALAILNDELKVKVEIAVVSGGTLAGQSLQTRLRILKDGAWTSTDTLTFTQDEPQAYLHLAPIGSDEIEVSGERELRGLLKVKVEESGAVIGELEFRIAKPLITLIHGYNTDGTWGEAFRAILEQTRPVVHTIRYGQGKQAMDSGLPGYLQSLSGAMMANTLFSLEDLVPMLANELENDLKPFHEEWAFTRHDVVAHSQGGLLSRMLSSHRPANVAPFRNEKNFFRGRFHRIVTIGSPHNGTRLVRYLLTLHRSAPPGADFVPLVDFSLPRVLSQLSVIGEVSQDKFDPWGDQIQNLNLHSALAQWKPDPGAQFHLVQTTVNGGRSPSPQQSSWAEYALGLNEPGVGAAVLPKGSDGVVDLESMGVGGNVFRLPTTLDVSHALLVGDDWIGDAFGGFDGGQVNAVTVARHVHSVLDQDAEVPAGDRRFGPFIVPTPLPPEVRAQVDKAALSRVDALFAHIAQLSAVEAAPDNRSARQDFGARTFSLTLTPPMNRPAGAAGVFWFAELFGTNGVTSEGLTVTPQPGNPFAATIEVASGMVGDVVAYAFYPSPAGGTVHSKPLRVASFEPDSPAEALAVLPDENPVPAGLRLRPQLFVRHADGSWLERFVESDEVVAISSEPSVVDVSNPLGWRFPSAGKATVTVNWRTLSATNDLTVFGHQASRSPVPEPLVWLKSDAGLSRTDDRVLSWTDQSRNGFVFSAPTEARQPLWVTNVVNGLPAIRFSTSQLVGNLGRTLTNATIFTLCRFTGGGNSTVAYGFGTPDFSGLMMSLGRRNGDGADHYDGAVNRVADDVIPGADFRVFSQVYGESGGDHHRLAVNLRTVLDTRTTTGRAYSAIATNVVLGKWITGTSYLVGDLVEWLVYDRVLRVDERLEVEEYLRQRAGLAPFFKDGSLELADSEVVNFNTSEMPEGNWILDTADREVVLAGPFDPAMLLTAPSAPEQTQRIRLSARAGTGSMGVVFGFQGRNQFHLFDWRPVSTEDAQRGIAPAGMRLRSFHLPEGQSPNGADFWSGLDPARVTTWRTNLLPWVPDREYDVELRLGAEQTVIEVKFGRSTLVSWIVPELKGVTGPVGHFVDGLPGARFGQVRWPGDGPMITHIEPGIEGTGVLRWMSGAPPYVIESAANLAANEWYPVAPATPSFSGSIPTTSDSAVFRIRSAGVVTADETDAQSQTFGNDGHLWLATRTGPMRIEAENFDEGGEGVAYHETTPQNQGGIFRAEAVDVSVTEDEGGGHAVSGVVAGEWLHYTLQVEEAGRYRLRARTSRGQSRTRSVRFLFGGVDKTGTLVVPATGNWESYTTVESPTFELSAGPQILRADMTSAGFNLNWIELVPVE